MTFHQYFGAVKTTLIALIIGGALAVVGVDISLLVNKNFMTQNPAIAIVSMVAALLIVLFAVLCLFNSWYKFKDDKFIACLGFFVDKIRYDEIISIKQNSETHDIYLIIKPLKPNQPSMFFRMNLRQEKIEDFLNKIREKCPDIVVESFEPNKKKK